MTGIYKLTGSLQHYVWGGHDYLPELLHIKKEPNQYYAEWWLGAHSSSPSTIEVEEKQLSLIDFIGQHPEVLGSQSRALFGDELPYLLKILDVKKPLSIQLHPTKKQAEIGFAEENSKGIDLKDAKRTYKDNNHKPEMMIALSDFWLLHGFKTKEKIIETLKNRPTLTALLSKLETQDMHGFYADIMQASQTELANWLLPIIESNKIAYEKGELSLENPDYWVLYAMEAMEISPEKLDSGLICFYLFNIVHTKTGEGIYQDAGIPHAYLRGQNIELMACSDNVIRGGLTPKHVDIPALLEVIDCREVVPEIIPPAPQENGAFIYSTPAKDFALENVRYDAGIKIESKAENATIIFVMQGTLKISQKNTALFLKQGESAFICADTQYRIEGIEQGYCVLSKLP
ncbi:mannose-6-phosphate isomerase, class I [Basfia succiniciproducens]|uniref:mannose-6-phosphate isomerase n=1 Tax=Basfia succiniciproducens TaxID=653940 RepID=A0A1G5BAX9_9PAST|nr:mannose-6-phosphate isomerase, class I [Basfia succiniciproducens]QIM68064.1 mannose-6-phosphate isomerase, class I [Basfia succiniciproducens]SCX87302.1 mannose-6-phosphate isomerase, type 1 [Basfia succiniciproducens]